MTAQQKVSLERAHIYDNYMLYDEVLTGFYAHNPGITDLLRILLEGYSGDCLDIGCGTGILDPMLEKMGFHVTGVDISEVQLKAAMRKNRLPKSIHANAANLPLKTSTFDIAISTYTHTDFDDWQAVINEAARVVKPGGAFVYIGPHPCFFGAHAKRYPSGKVVSFPEYYWNEERIFKAPGFSVGGVRETVGEKHLSLGALLNAFHVAGFRLEHIVEDNSHNLPMSIGIRAILDSV